MERVEPGKRQVALSVNQIFSLARMVRNARRKKERQIDKSTFVPEPGKRHAGDYTHDKLCDLEDLLCEALGITWEELDDAAAKNAADNRQRSDGLAG